ncbi:MAG TPA: hypothetical protein VGM86_00490 [Thermoanaerobaculia bacterium]|jgi:hypothetical protein
MRTIQRTIATAEVLLVLPATLFLLALFVRNLQPVPYEPATTARHLVEWFAAHPPIGLQLFLIALPFTAFVIGGATVLLSWRRDAELRQATLKMLATVRAHLATLLIVGATLVAAGTLGVVFLHMAAD